MSSSALILVNKVLLMTGDGGQLATIVGSPGDIADRIIQFMNLTISDIENKANWSILQDESVGAGDGISDIFDYVGASAVKAGSAVSVWVEGVGQLDEVTPEQFNIIIATSELTGRPKIFQRKTGTAGNLQVQIFPMPALNDIVHVSAYTSASRLSDDASTTEFDDETILYGALMHMDAYDGLQRGYSALFTRSLNSLLARNQSNSNYRVYVESYR